MNLRRTIAIAAATLSATLGWAAPALAGCGGVQHRAAINPPKALGRPALVIGDSVLLGAMGPVAAAGFEINTKGCRPWREGIKIISARKASGSLPRLVFVALGSNGGVNSAQLQQALSLMGRDRILGLVTPRGNGNSAGNAVPTIRAFAKRHPGRVVLADWVAVSAGKSSYFAADGLHLGHPGARALATLLRESRRNVTPALCR